MLSSNLRVGLAVLLAAAGCTQNFDDFRGNGGSGGGGVGGLGGGGGAPCDCDDENICTQDLCDPEGACLHPAATVVTVPQVTGDCKNAICEGTVLGQEADTDDTPGDEGNPCTSESCDGDMPGHPFEPVGTNCNDGVCNATGQCSDCDDAADCGTDTECATYACTDNECVTTYLAPKVVSGVGDADFCTALLCVDLEPDPQVLPYDMDPEIDSNPCTTDTCDALGDPVHGPIGAGTLCDNGMFCDGMDACDAGTTCVSAGDPCAGGTECADSCNEANDNCFDAGGTACGNSANTPCSNPDTCNGSGTCSLNNEAVGFLCGDTANTTCTDPDTCDANAACLPNHAGVGASCNDSLFCTMTDTCNASGACAGTGNPCAGGTDCADNCNETNDNCFDAIGTACGDTLNTTCTDPDTCNATGTCLPNHVTVVTACMPPAGGTCNLGTGICGP